MSVTIHSKTCHASVRRPSVTGNSSHPATLPRHAHVKWGNDTPATHVISGYPRMRLLPALLTPLALANPALATDDCAKQTALWQEINLSSGLYTERAVVNVPLKIRIPAGVDAGAMMECLRLEGFDPPAELAAEVERAAACRAHARSLRLTVRDGAAGAARIGGGMDDARYRACLAGEITVDVLPPE